MDPVLRLALMFGLGLFVQAVFLVKNDLKKNIWRFLRVLAPSIAMAAIFSFFILTDDSNALDNADIFRFLLWLYLIFIISFISLFFYRALYEINEKILLVWTLIFWYASAANFSVSQEANIFFLIMTLIVVAAALIPKRISYFWKGALYVWFIIIVLILTLIQTNSAGLNFDLLLRSNEQAVFYDNYPNGYLTAFLSGMMFLNVMLYGAHLLAFLPYKNKHQNYAGRIREVEMRFMNLGIKFSDYQMSLKEGLMVLVMVGGIFLGNYYLKIMSNELVINLAIIGSFLYSERPGLRREALCQLVW